MSNAHDTMRQALREAKEVMQAADDHASALVDLLIGEAHLPSPERLRHVGPNRLRRLKAALRDFDATALKWKDAK